MSTSIATPSSTPLVTQITAGTLQYAPAVIAGIQAAEAAAQQTAATGAQKHDAVLNGILQGIQVGSGALAQGTGQVAAISGLINLFVSIFNGLNLFHHSIPAPPAGGTA